MGQIGLVTPRDTRLLSMVGLLRLATRDQLARSLPADWFFPSATVKLNDRLAKLAGAGLVKRFRPLAGRGEGSMQYHYHLGARPRRWGHIAMVSEVYAQLASDPRLSILAWRAEPELAGTGGGRADALVVIEAPKVGRAMVVYVECDTGTEPRATLAAKFDQYHLHERAGLWRREDYVARQVRPTYPLVWLVTARRYREGEGCWVVGSAKEAVERWLGMERRGR